MEGNRKHTQQESLPQRGRSDHWQVGRAFPHPSFPISMQRTRNKKAESQEIKELAEGVGRMQRR